MDLLIVCRDRSSGEVTVLAGQPFTDRDAALTALTEAAAAGRLVSSDAFLVDLAAVSPVVLVPASSAVAVDPADEALLPVEAVEEAADEPAPSVAEEPEAVLAVEVHETAVSAEEPEPLGVEEPEADNAPEPSVQVPEPWEAAAAAFGASVEDEETHRKDAMRDAISAALAGQPVTADAAPGDNGHAAADATSAGDVTAEAASETPADVVALPVDDVPATEAVAEAAPEPAPSEDELAMAEVADVTSVDLDDMPVLEEESPEEQVAIADTPGTPQWPWDVPESALDEEEAPEIEDAARPEPEATPAAGSSELDEAPLTGVPSPPPLTTAEGTMTAVVEPLGIQEASAVATATLEAPAQAESPALQMNEYTCDDCVYVNTCPNQHQKAPTECGSFQWKSM